MNRIAMLTLAAALSVPPALAAGDPDVGLATVRLWCTGCHAVEAQPERAPADNVPSFRSVARSTAYDRGWVRAFLNNPHPPMPNLNLTTREIDDITAYLDRLHAGS